MPETETINVNWRLPVETVKRTRAAAALAGKGVQQYVAECLANCTEHSGLPPVGTVTDPAAEYKP